MDNWYVVYTRPREEEVARANLVRQGFMTYWPRYRKRFSHARKVHEAPASLFPRYLFVHFDLASTEWRAIRSTRGVVGLVRQGADPVAVSSRLINDIRAREDELGFVVLARQVELHRGQRIEIQRDAFRGHKLIFETSKDSERVVALLTLLGREFEVELPIRSVVPLT